MLRVMERDQDVTSRTVNVRILVAMVVAIGVGWLLAPIGRSHEKPPFLDIHSLEYGRKPSGDGWFVEARFQAEDVGDRQVALEVYGFRESGSNRSRIVVPPGATSARIDLPDLPMAEDGRRIAVGGWWPGEAWVRLLLLQDGRQVYASDESRLELSGRWGDTDVVPTSD
jgi:hypothetical protein